MTILSDSVAPPSALGEADRPVAIPRDESGDAARSGLIRLDSEGEAGKPRLIPAGIERLLGVVLLFTLWETASRLGEDLVDANLQMLRFVPIIALQPLFILWLGVGEVTKISMIVLGVVFLVYVNTSAAIRSIPPGYLELAKVLGLSRATTLQKIVLPGALGGFTVGVRMATSIAWLLLVFAEQVNASSGLGFMMVRAQTFGRSPGSTPASTVSCSSRSAARSCSRTTASFRGSRSSTTPSSARTTARRATQGSQRSPRWASPITPTPGPRRCRVANPSAWRWPVPWCASRSCCCWTNRSAHSTPSLD